MISIWIEIIGNILKGIIAYEVGKAVRQYQRITETTAVSDLQRDAVQMRIHDLMEYQFKTFEANQAKLKSAFDEMFAIKKGIYDRIEANKKTDASLGI